MYREQLRVGVDGSTYPDCLGTSAGALHFYRLIASSNYLSQRVVPETDARPRHGSRKRHYQVKAQPAGRLADAGFISSYATMHAVMRIGPRRSALITALLICRDALDTAAWCRLAPASAAFDRPALNLALLPSTDKWLPHIRGVMVNRSMGPTDLYPIAADAVLEKMRDFIHRRREWPPDDLDRPRPSHRLGRHHPPVVWTPLADCMPPNA